MLSIWVMIFSIFMSGCYHNIHEYTSGNIIKINTKEVIENNKSEGIVSFWRVQNVNSDNRIVEWFELIVIPNNDNSGYRFLGVIVTPGSLFDYGIRAGDPILYVNKISTTSEMTSFLGVWYDLSTYSKEWKAIRFDINSQNGVIYNSGNISFTASKYCVDEAHTFFIRPRNNDRQNNYNLHSSAGGVSGKGNVSKIVGGAKTVPVRGYYRKNGTYVRPHYRSPPRR